MNTDDFIPKRRKGLYLTALSILSGGFITLLLSVTITGQADRVANVPPSPYRTWIPQAFHTETIGLRNWQHELHLQRYSERLGQSVLNEQDWARLASELRKLLSSLLAYGSSLLRTPITFPGVEVAGFTIPSLVLPLGLLVTGLLVILAVVVLVSLKIRRARTKHSEEQTQELAHAAADKGEAHHRADERAGIQVLPGKPTEPELASPRSQAERPQGDAGRTPRYPGQPQGYAPTAAVKRPTPRYAERPQGDAGRTPQYAPTAATPIGQRMADLPCPNCGQLMPAEATFCSQCGVLLAASESGQHLKIPPSSPLETSESSQDSPSVCSESPPLSDLTSGSDGLQGSTSWAQSDTSVGAYRGARPARLPASKVRHEPEAETRPGGTSNKHTHMAIPSSSEEEVLSTGLTVGARSHPGIKRQHRPNEDSLLVAQGMRTYTVPPQPFGVFIVADGMGGHKYGQEASSQAIQMMIDQMLPKLSSNLELHTTELRQLLVDAVQAANQVIHQCNQEQYTNRGTTVTAALVVGLTAFVANVGDSRTYLYREPEGLRKITNDHSVVAYLVETGIIKPDDIYTHAQRNQIYRSLGAKPLIQVDVFIEPLQPGDIVLLCSDGLWEMVRDPVIQQILRSGTDPSQMASALIEAALDGGGADNVSVIVGHVS